MPKSFAVLAADPSTDRKMPASLPGALARALEPHRAELGNVFACGGHTNHRWPPEGFLIAYHVLRYALELQKCMFYQGF